MEQLGILIPIIAMMIPLTIVAGRFVIQPIVQALGKLAEKQGNMENVAHLAGRLDAQGERVDRSETLLRRLEEALDFHRQLGAGEERTGLRPE